MKLVAFGALAVIVSSSTLGQNPADVTKTLVCDNPTACSRGYINGRKYETMTSGNIVVFIVGDIYGKYLRADILVLNKSSATVDVLPSNFVLTEVAPKPKQLKRVDGDKLLRSEGKRVAWGNALTAMSGNMARQQSTTTTNSNGTISSGSATGTYNGTSRSTTSAPDYAAQARAEETIRQRNEAFSSFASAASNAILRANSVLPNQTAHGFMLFERDKKATVVMLSGIVGDTIYQFPFEI